MKLLVVNSKGGVGKSFISQQILAPYMFERVKQKIRLVEIDEMNCDSRSFVNTQIFDSEQLFTRDIEAKLFDIVQNSSNLIIDVGGNKSAEIVLNYLLESRLYMFFDVVVVPVLNNEQDALNALEIVNKLKDKCKIVLVLNKCKMNIDIKFQYPYLYGFDEIEAVFKQIPETIEVYETELAVYSRNYAITIYEISKMNIEEYEKKLREAMQNNNKEEVKKNSMRLVLIERAKKYMQSLDFSALDKLIGGVKNERTSKKQQRS